jgi:hypothetical protein
MPRRILCLVENVVGHVGVLVTHGRRAMTKLLLGSDAELAFRRAKMPVLLVRSVR